MPRRRVNAFPVFPEALVVLLLIVALVGCGDRAPSLAEPRLSRIELLVTPDVAAMITSEGMFRPTVTAGTADALLGTADAHRLANAWIRTFGPTASQFWSAARGAEIDWTSLKRCGRIEYAESAYDLGSVAETSLVRTLLGAVYLITYCGQSGAPELLLSVDASAGHLTVLGDGRIARSSARGMTGSIRAYGIPLSDQFGLIPTAEDAVLLAVRTTGRRVASVPRLVRAPHPASPQYSRWIVDLEPRPAGGSDAVPLDTIALVGLSPSRNRVRDVWQAPADHVTVIDDVVFPSDDPLTPKTLRLARSRSTHGLKIDPTSPRE